MMKTPRVFVSMGTPFTAEQMRVRDELQSMLGNRCGVDPRIIGVNEYPAGNPLHHIRDVMATCNGVMIVAYERKFMEKGIDKRGGEKPRELTGEKYTTPWNHVESAIAYSLGLPIYIICEKGLTEECLIEDKSDWYVQRVEFTESGLKSQQVVESVRSWVNGRVIPHAKKPRSLFGAIAKLQISEMTLPDLKFVIVLLVGAFGFGVAVGKYLPWSH